MKGRKLPGKREVARLGTSFSRSRQSAQWDEAMRLGLVGLVSVFLFKTFYDVYLGDGTPNYPFGIYLGAVFGVVLAVVWKKWPWRL